MRLIKYILLSTKIRFSIDVDFDDDNKKYIYEITIELSPSEKQVIANYSKRTNFLEIQNSLLLK